MWLSGCSTRWGGVRGVISLWLLKWTSLGASQRCLWANTVCGLLWETLLFSGDAQLRYQPDETMQISNFACVGIVLFLKFPFNSMLLLVLLMLCPKVLWSICVKCLPCSALLDFSDGWSNSHKCSLILQNTACLWGALILMENQVINCLAPCKSGAYVGCCKRCYEKGKIHCVCRNLLYHNISCGY